MCWRWKAATGASLAATGGCRAQLRAAGNTAGNIVARRRAPFSAACFLRDRGTAPCCTQV